MPVCGLETAHRQFGGEFQQCGRFASVFRAPGESCVFYVGPFAYLDSSVLLRVHNKVFQFQCSGPYFLVFGWGDADACIASSPWDFPISHPTLESAVAGNLDTESATAEKPSLEDEYPGVPGKPEYLPLGANSRVRREIGVAP